MRARTYHAPTALVAIPGRLNQDNRLVWERQEAEEEGAAGGGAEVVDRIGSVRSRRQRDVDGLRRPGG